jgi:hypothetical protein
LYVFEEIAVNLAKKSGYFLFLYDFKKIYKNIFCNILDLSDPPKEIICGRNKTADTKCSLAVATHICTKKVLSNFNVFFYKYKAGKDLLTVLENKCFNNKSKHLKEKYREIVFATIPSFIKMIQDIDLLKSC